MPENLFHYTVYGQPTFAVMYRMYNIKLASKLLRYVEWHGTVVNCTAVTLSGIKCRTNRQTDRSRPSRPQPHVEWPISYWHRYRYFYENSTNRLTFDTRDTSGENAKQIYTVQHAVRGAMTHWRKDVHLGLRIHLYMADCELICTACLY